MGNGLWSMVSSIKKTIDHIDSKVNFSMPQNLMSYLWPKGEMDDRNLEITQNNFRLQIGKMDKQNETIYTKDILLPAIEYISKKTPAEQKAIIQLRPDLAKYLANYDQKDKANQILSFEEEKQAIIKIIKKYQKQSLSKINIISVAKQYPDLFDILKTQGIEWLYSLNKPVLTRDKLSPRLLTEYIYWVVQHNPKLMKVFYDTKTPAQKEADHKPIWQNQSDYYSVVEVWVRLYEVLSWISIQWGIDRQSKYDNIIWAILSGRNMEYFKITDFPELEELHNFCKEINPDFTFERLWIDTKGVREVVEKEKWRSKVKQYTRNTTIALATALALFSSGYKFSQYKQKMDNQYRKQEYRYNDINHRGVQAEIYYYKLDKLSNQLTDKFIQTFWAWDLSKDGIEEEIALYLQYDWKRRFNILAKQDIHPNEIIGELRNRFIRTYQGWELWKDITDEEIALLPENEVQERFNTIEKPHEINSFLEEFVNTRFRYTMINHWFHL